MSISRDTLRNIRPEINAALAVIAAAHGLKSLTVGSGSFDAASGHFTLKLEGVAEGGIDKNAATYERSRLYKPSLPPLGTTFKVGREAYEIVGMNSAGGRLNVRRVSDGKSFLYNADAAIAACARQAA
jgi:hypothetical protein